MATVMYQEFLAKLGDLDLIWEREGFAGMDMWSALVVQPDGR